MKFVTRAYKLIDHDGKEYEPPQMYDVYNDTIRVVTQADVDELLAIKKAYGELWRHFRDGDELMRSEAAKKTAAGSATVAYDPSFGSKPMTADEKHGVLDSTKPKIVDRKKYLGPAITDFEAIKKRMKERAGE